MSLLYEGENNRGTPLESSDSATPYQRDPNYYYPDGSTVILVENILFKLHLSLILGPHDNPNDSTSGNLVLRKQLVDSSDAKPARLEEFTLDQFRNFLSIVLGLPSDPGYLALLTSAQDIKSHGCGLLIKYLDIASLSRQFGMAQLEKWAQEQLKLVLQSSHSFADSEWSKNALHRLHSYAHSSGDPALRLPVRNFIQYFISVAAHRDQQPSTSVPSNLNTCVELYKDTTLKEQDPALFGCLFAAMVSQDHWSGAWASMLAQQDQSLLYVAQVRLTSIAQVLERLRWLIDPVSKLPLFTRMCPTCQAALPGLWANTFGRCGNLDSKVLLKDISSLADLPQHFYSLTQNWANVGCTGLPGSGADNHQGRLYSVLMFITLSRQTPTHEGLPKEQTCWNNLLPEISVLIDEVYNELAARHTGFESVIRI